MPEFSFSNIAISGIASAVPENEVSVDSLASIFGEKKVSMVKSLTGVSSFRKTLEDQTAADLGFAAARNLIISKNIDPAEIGALIFVSQSPDYRRPATACVLHDRLELSQECAAFDINLGCSGYPYGIFQTGSLMANSNIKNALLICAETSTKVTNPGDRTTALLFGDCGTATLLSKSSQNTNLNGSVRTYGKGYPSIILPAGGFRNRFVSRDIFNWNDGQPRSLHDLHMDGLAVLHFTLTQVPELVSDFLEKNNSVIDKYSSVIFHQANLHILKQLSHKLNIPIDKVPISLDRYGNTSSASIPLTLCDTYSTSNSSENINVLMCGFGAGLSLGVVSAEISTGDILPIISTSDFYKKGMINLPSDLQSQNS